MIKAYKLFTAEDGHSYVQEGSVSEDFLASGVSIRFKETPAGAEYDWHPAPETRYVLTLTGSLEFTTFLGETFQVHPGDVLIAMDTTGSGHKWKMLGDQPWKRAYVAFKPDEDLNFVPKTII